MEVAGGRLGASADRRVSSDLAGYGDPGFGAIQFVGSVLSFAAVAFGVVGLSNHRREDEPAPPKLPGIPPAAK